MLDMHVCELLAARLCHDLAGPIAAISNGAELLGDDDPDFAREAATLIGDSARTAARRLQLFRFVYGFGGGTGAGPLPHALAAEYFAGSNIECDYPETVRQLEPEWQRLACSLLFVGVEGLPRGGRLVLAAASGGVALTGIGDGDGPPPQTRDVLTPAAPVESLTSRNVGAYFAAVLAETLGRRLVLRAELGRFQITCETGA
jgi:histidine phosphotransferase ChpT